MTMEPLQTIFEIMGPVADKRILDVGCGYGQLCKALSASGAKAFGVDPDENSVEHAIRAAPQSLFIRAGAERLPFASGTFDGIVFLNSLHHVAVDSMITALDEAIRVLRPSAKLIVVEPLAEGTFFDTFKVIEDETSVRAAAQAALLKAGRDRPVSLKETRQLHRLEMFQNLEQFVLRILQADIARTPVVASKRAVLEAAFNRNAEASAMGYALIQPLRAYVFARH